MNKNKWITNRIANLIANDILIILLTFWKENNCCLVVDIWNMSSQHDNIVRFLKFLKYFQH